MTTVTVHEAKTNFSDLLRRVEEGEEIVIARGDTSVAVLKGLDAGDISRRREAAFGCLAGKLASPQDSAFFDPLTEADLVQMFATAC